MVSREQLSIKSGEFPLILDARMINKRLNDIIKIGEKILLLDFDGKEELSLVRYLENTLQ